MKETSASDHHEHKLKSPHHANTVVLLDTVFAG